MKYNIIGDIHGRTNWKQLVDADAVNVFLGDYFDPHDKISVDKLTDNFLDIIDYKKSHPDNVVLLYGNHDFHYIFPEYGGTTSRYDKCNAEHFKEMFDEYKDLFYGIAYCPVNSTGDKSDYIITHAGITDAWFYRYCDTDDFPGRYTDGRKIPQPGWVERFINNLWNTTTDGREFSFRYNCDWFDTYGTTPTQSPIWIRPEALDKNNLYKNSGVIQIVGHTQMYKVQDASRVIGLVFADCLGQATESYKFEI